MEQLPKQLGCLPDPHDEQDHIYTGAPPELLKIMPTIEEGYNVEDEIGEIPDFNQFSTLGCTAFGLASDLSHLILSRTGDIKTFSKRWIYSQTYLPKTDTYQGGGAYVRDVYKLAHQKGICEDRFMPTYKPDGSLDETWLRNKSDITPEAIANAAENKISEYLRIPTDDFDLLLQGIFESKGVGCGLRGVNASRGHFFEFDGFGMYNGYPGVLRKDSIPIWRNGKLDFNRWIIKVGDKYYQENTRGAQVILYSHWLAKRDFSEDMKINEKELKKLYALIFHRELDEKAYNHIGVELALLLNTLKGSEEWKKLDRKVILIRAIENFFNKILLKK